MPLCNRAGKTFLYSPRGVRAATQLFSLRTPVHKKTLQTRSMNEFEVFFTAGDERIELPPKVLETPIIPFDQSPVL